MLGLFAGVGSGSAGTKRASATGFSASGSSRDAEGTGVCPSPGVGDGLGSPGAGVRGVILAGSGPKRGAGVVSPSSCVRGTTRAPSDFGSPGKGVDAGFSNSGFVGTNNGMRAGSPDFGSPIFSARGSPR